MNEDRTAAEVPGGTPVERPVRPGFWPHFWDGIGLGPLWRWLWLRDLNREARLLADMDKLISTLGKLEQENQALRNEVRQLRSEVAAADAQVMRAVSDLKKLTAYADTLNERCIADAADAESFRRMKEHEWPSDMVGIVERLQADHARMNALDHPGRWYTFWMGKQTTDGFMTSFVPPGEDVRAAVDRFYGLKA